MWRIAIMKKVTSSAFAILILLGSVACGGGGGGSSSPAPTQSGGGATGGTGGGTGGTGGNTGGGAGGTGTVVTGGLVPGGGAVVVNTGENDVVFDVASGGTGASFDFGDIQAFGSVILNDATVNTDNAAFFVEGVPGAQSDLRQGQQVLVIGNADGTIANSVHYRSNVEGPVTSASLIDVALGTASFNVLGQVVRTDATTTFANVNLATIVVGDLLEISGTLNSAGEIQASFVELKATLTEYKVIGAVSSVTATNFSLNNLTVDYSSATLQDFNGPVTNDDVVEVKAPPSGFTTPDQLAATRVELLPTLTVGSSVPARVEGFIDRFSSSSDFDVQTAPVSTDANTTFINGTATSLGLNVKVQAEGTFNGNGVLLAQRVTIQSTDAIRAEGHVESIDLTARTVDVLGVQFLVRDLTQFDDSSAAGVDPLELSDLGLGDEVEIRGYLDGTLVVATEIEREDPEDRARLRGPVTAEDAANGTVDVLSVRLTGQAGVTEYNDINDATITQTQFYDQVEIGTIVKGDWDVFVDTNQTVDELSIED